MTTPMYEYQPEGMEEGTHLFIGGPADGKCLSVEPKGTKYNALHFVGLNIGFIIYVLDGLSKDDVMKVLIGSYAGIEESQIGKSLPQISDEIC